MSAFGHWAEEAGLPVFRETTHPTDDVCRWDPQIGPPTNRHWSGFGNRRFQVIADNDGTTAIWDTNRGLDWLTAAEPGSGASVVAIDGDEIWATDLPRWPSSWVSAGAPVRTWGPTWFTVAGRHDGIDIERMVGCPEGELPCVLVRVTLTADRDVAVELAEEWRIAPRSVPLHRLALAPDHDLAAQTYTTMTDDQHVDVLVTGSTAAPQRFLRLQSPDPIGRAESDAGTPTIRLVRQVELAAGAPVVIWFVLGSGDLPADPGSLWKASLEGLRSRLPSAESSRVPALRREVRWHSALLTGGACTDAVLGGHTLDQASAYSFHLGFNGAARDPLQHALPLVYSEPDLALSVLRNTCSWAAPDGELPYAIHGNKQPLIGLYEPSDQALWALWLAAEYLAATGDVEAMAAPLGFHPVYESSLAPLVEHLVRQYRHLVDVVGVGAHGHIRIRNADWNDSALVLSPVERSVMQAEGESVLNSAMAAWVLPRFAGLLRRLARSELNGVDGRELDEVASDADRRAEAWRQLVASEWNGRWFHRAHGPGAVIGDDDCWLEVQPWAILSGAATGEQAAALLATIDDVLRQDSPLGARLRGPLPIRVPDERIAGEGTSGGIWFSINMTLAWAARDIDREMAWDELGKMTLAAHTAAYPNIWEGTISGPDAYNTPESPRPGATWAWRPGDIAMQSFPVTNLHAHAQVVFTYLRLLGVEPTPDGALRVAGGDGSFRSRTFELAEDGRGRIETVGPVRVETSGRTVEGSGTVSWS